jgi:Zn-dependent protease with chaperone function
VGPAELATYFPPSPHSPPPGLTQASPLYRRHVWLASLGLLAFVGLYLGLTGYLAWVIYRLLGRALIHGGNVWAALFTSLPAAFFLAFLVRGLFVVKTGSPPGSQRELKRADEPLLFAFLDRLADETGAPRPYRVFVTAGVNASVFYDVSLLNLLWPSRKNLNLGLGLINVLTLDELKAVVAHEYGHFAQRSMAVGRWVYVAQQATGHVILSRGFFDDALRVLSGIDLRIAWIGWIMRVFVWAIRAVLDSAFRLVVLADRALGREMELQADRIAVSVSGSDSLVHALHRLGPADEAWEEALGFAIEELNAGRPISDLFHLQTLVLDHLRRILDQPELGMTPSRPQSAEQRVFDDTLAHPPRMWLTHPPNREREDHAKAVYLPSALDPRPAWLLFARPEQLRQDVTRGMIKEALTQKEGVPAKDPPDTTLEERLARRYGGRSLDPRYRGVYLGRSVAGHHRAAAELYGPPLSLDRTLVLSALDGLYPPSIKQELKDYRERREEERMLEGLADGVLTAPGGVIRYRGQEIRRRELAGVIASVKNERLEVERRIIAHDRTCRTAHLAAAQLLGAGWPAYLLSLGELLHYSTHTLRNVADVYGALQHVIDVVTLDGRVSDAERARVLGTSEDLQRVLEEVFHQQSQLLLPEAIQRRVDEVGGTPTLKQKLGLPMPSAENLGDWLQVVDGWVRGALDDLRALNHAILETLLEAEVQVADALTAGEPIAESPGPGRPPPRYASCAFGQERERQKKLSWWDRFQIADGLGPGLLRAGAAVGLLAPALFVGGTIGAATIHVANGLEIPVLVKVDEEELIVPARSVRSLSLSGVERAHLAAFRRLPGGAGPAIEGLDVDLPGGFSDSVYNVGQAGTFVEWTAVYGEHARELPPRFFGCASLVRGGAGRVV